MTRRLMLAASLLVAASSVASAQQKMWTFNGGLGLPVQGGWGENTNSGFAAGVGLLMPLKWGLSMGPVVSQSTFKADRAKLTGANDYRVSWQSIGLGVRKTFFDQRFFLRPYVGVGTGLAILQSRISLNGPAEQRFNVGATAGPEAGLLLRLDPTLIDFHMDYNTLRTSTMRFTDAFATNTLHAMRFQIGMTFPGLF